MSNKEKRSTSTQICASGWASNARELAQERATTAALAKLVGVLFGSGLSPTFLVKAKMFEGLIEFIEELIPN